MNNRQSHLQQLTEIVGENGLIIDNSLHEKYVIDWRGRYRGQALAVALPQNIEQISKLLNFCNNHQIKVIPQGGNTSLCGGSTPDSTGDALLINVSNLNKIINFDPINRHLVVQSGCTLEQIHQYLADSDLIFPLDLASAGSCQIGGNISTNAGGIHVIRYGNMRDLVLGLEVVLANGEVWTNLNFLRKVSCGYDLKHNFIGAEGTLGIITTAVLKLFPRAKFTYTLWLAFEKIEESIQLLKDMQRQFGDAVSSFELMSVTAIDLLQKYFPQLNMPTTNGKYFILAELSFFTDQQAEIESFFSSVNENYAPLQVILAQSEQQKIAMWRCRELIPEAQKLNGLSVKHDIALPISALEQFLKEAQMTLVSVFPDVAIINFGHLGDGSLHYNICFVISDNQRILLEENKITRIVHDLVNKYNGTISAEHGIGKLQREDLARYKSPLEISIMRQIKSTLDPNNILNPGVIF